MRKIILYQKKYLVPAIIGCVVYFLYSQNSGSNVEATDWGTTETSATSQSSTANGSPPLNNDASSGNEYIIKSGDCLWNLAFQFLGNPFQWPGIWQINPFIKNPDRIYPGDHLKIPGRNNGVSTSEVPPNGVATSPQNGNRSILPSKTGTLLNGASLQKDKLGATLRNGISDSVLLLIIRSKDQLGGSFFASVPFLWFERNASGVLLPGESVVDHPSDRAMYQLYDNLTITPRKGEIFKKGDSLDLYSYFRVVEFNHARATVLKCVGCACISEVRNDKVFATLYKAYDKVLGGEHMISAHHTKGREIDTLVNPDVSIQGTVFTRAEETESPYIFETLIIDKGSQDGVKIGDVFGVYHNKANELSSEIAVIGYTANVQKSSSSITIIKMADNKVSEGDKVSLIKRTVFKGSEN